MNCKPKDLRIVQWMNLHLNATATMCLVHRRGLAKEKPVDTQNLWIQYASKSKRFVTKKVGTNVNPADLMTKPLLGPTIVQNMKIMGYQFVGGASGARRVRLHETDELTPSCRNDRCVLAVCYGNASDKDDWMVCNSLPKMFEQLSGSDFGTCPRRSVLTLGT